MRETSKSAAAFEEYAAMGPSRSLRKLAEKLKQTDSKPIATEATLMVWSTEHQWQSRVAQYDKERSEEKRMKREAAIEQMNETHAQLGSAQALLAVKQIEALIKAQKFGSQAAVQLFKISTDLERVARGVPTEHTEHSGTLDLSGQVGFYKPVELPQKRSIEPRESDVNADSE